MSKHRIWPVYVILQKKDYQKILQTFRPENSFQALLCLQRIKHNIYWKMKFLKQSTHMSYALAELSKFVKISTLTSSDSFLQGIP